MAFPTTSVLDNFTGVDGTTPPNANWSQAVQDSTVNGLKIISNQVYSGSSSARGSDYWNPSTFGPDAEIFVTVATLMLAGEDLRLYLRVTNPTNAATFSGYRLIYQHATGYTIQKVVNGAATTLKGPTNTNGLNAGDKVGFGVVGSTLTAYRFNVSTGLWVTVDSVVDATFSGAGYLVLTADHETVRLDNFGGGTVVSSSATHVGPFAGKLAMEADILVEWGIGGRQQVGSGLAPSLAPSIGGR